MLTKVKKIISKTRHTDFFYRLSSLLLLSSLTAYLALGRLTLNPILYTLHTAILVASTSFFSIAMVLNARNTWQSFKEKKTKLNFFEAAVATLSASMIIVLPLIFSIVPNGHGEKEIFNSISLTAGVALVTSVVAFGFRFCSMAYKFYQASSRKNSEQSQLAYKRSAIGDLASLFSVGIILASSLSPISWAIASIVIMSTQVAWYVLPIATKTKIFCTLGLAKKNSEKEIELDDIHQQQRNMLNALPTGETEPEKKINVKNDKEKNPANKVNTKSCGEPVGEPTKQVLFI